MICSFNSSVNRCYKTSQPTHTTIQNSLTQPTPTAILVSLSPPRVDDPSKRKFPWIVFGVSVSSSLVLSFVLTVVWKLFKRLAKFQKSSNRTSEKVTTCELPLKDLVEELSLIVQDTSPERTTLADSKPLRDLLNSSELEEICELLDAPVCGKLPYEAISRWYGASHTRIKPRFQEGKSEAVIAWLVAEKPELTVGEFATVVKDKARRTDAADKLKAFDAKATIELTCEMHI
ncbi:uncharacterized protein LOC111337476 [Stylophora pistillata]|uniref:uncharacterized protein LOC111337476 n=1 Tax=Stylophora pistillata TaxID=50429 RepID=UPI000C03CCA3|nr:uncharacterized protein LOC111337476 [Stylophora pistillata]